MEQHNASWWGFPAGLGASVLAAAVSWASSFELWLRLAVLFVGLVSAVLTAGHFWMRLKRDRLEYSVREAKLREVLARNNIRKDDTTK